MHAFIYTYTDTHTSYIHTYTHTHIHTGEPMKFTCSEPGKPKPEEIDAAHKEYMEAVKKLFDQHKGALGYGSRTLEIC
jgi:hypothetical protein